MPKFKGHFRLLKLDSKKYTQTLNRRAEALNKKAAREAVAAIIKRVPVWTGMARGSIKFAKGRSGESAGRSLHEFLRIQIPINPVEVRKKKNPAAGGKQGRYTFSHYHGKYHFTLSSNVLHYVINEWYDVGLPHNPRFPRPWMSFEAGNLAYQDYITKNVKSIFPKLGDFLTGGNVPLDS